MREITIRLLTVQEKGVDGYSVHGDNLIQVELDQETYAKFEEDAGRFGLDICDALGHILTSMIKKGLP